MLNDKVKKEEGNQKTKANTQVANIKNGNTSGKTEIIEKPKAKKPDKTIEKLKSKHPEEIRKEIKKDFKSQAVKYKTISIILSVILFVILFLLATVISYYKNAIRPPETNFVPEAEIDLPPDTPEDEVDTSDWESYQNNKLGIYFKHPPYIKVKEGENEITLASEEIKCTTNATGNPENITVSNYLIEIVQHNSTNTSSYEEVWENIFGYQFQGGDGETSIGSRTGNYFFQGAENLYGRQAILLQESENTYFEINVYTPILAYNCEKELINQQTHKEVNDKILSTLKFLSSQVQGVATSNSICINENQEILSEVIECEEITEESCIKHVDQFEYCMKSCLNVLDEEECGDICRPVCEEEMPEEL